MVTFAIAPGFLTIPPDRSAEMSDWVRTQGQASYFYGISALLVGPSWTLKKVFSPSSYPQTFHSLGSAGRGHFFWRNREEEMAWLLFIREN